MLDLYTVFITEDAPACSKMAAIETVTYSRYMRVIVRLGVDRYMTTMKRYTKNSLEYPSVSIVLHCLWLGVVRG